MSINEKDINIVEEKLKEKDRKFAKLKKVGAGNLQEYAQKYFVTDTQTHFLHTASNFQETVNNIARKLWDPSTKKEAIDELVQMPKAQVVAIFEAIDEMLDTRNKDLNVEFSEIKKEFPK